MGISLQVRDLAGNVRLFEADDQVLIGRDPTQATLVLDDEYVSRLHCVLQRRKDGQWVVIHRGRNPSWLDGRDLSRPGEQAILPERSALLIGLAEIAVLVCEDAITDVDAVPALEGDEEVAAGAQWLEVSYADDDDDRTLADEEVPRLLTEPLLNIAPPVQTKPRDPILTENHWQMASKGSILGLDDADHLPDEGSLETQIPPIGDVDEVPEQRRQKYVGAGRLREAMRRLFGRR